MLAFIATIVSSRGLGVLGRIASRTEPEECRIILVVLVEERERLSIFLESAGTCLAGAWKLDEMSVSWEGGLENESSRPVVLAVVGAVSILLGSMPVGASMRSVLCGDCGIVYMLGARWSSADEAWSVTSFPYYTHGRGVYQCTDFGTLAYPRGGPRLRVMTYFSSKVLPHFWQNFASTKFLCLHTGQVFIGTDSSELEALMKTTSPIFST